MLVVLLHVLIQLIAAIQNKLFGIWFDIWYWSTQNQENSIYQV